MRDAVLVLILLALAIAPLALLLYPWILKLLGYLRTSSMPANSASASATPLSVALVTVCDRLDVRLDEKLVEFSELAHLSSVTECHVGLDGVAPPEGNSIGDDNSEIKARPSIIWTSVGERAGKNSVLSRIHAKSLCDVLVFTDVDARVSTASLKKLLSAFDDPEVGAVTGRRVISDESGFAQAQAGYASLDSRIRQLEMVCFRSVTSCDGKLYAIRRPLLGDLPGDVTDDLHTGLGAVAAGYRLSFEPEATARIGRPARDWRHEMRRRRRVTCRGLSTLWHRRALMNPCRHGVYALALFINKGLRRLAAPCVLLAGAIVALVSLSAAASSGLIFLFSVCIAVLLSACLEQLA